MKKSRYLLVVLLALVVEIFVFNFWNVMSLLNNAPYNADVGNELVLNAGYDGTNVQWLMDVGTDRKIYNALITTDAVCYPDFFYTDANGIIQRLPFKKCGNNKYIVTIGKKITGAIGVSVYGDVNIESLSINARAISFSIARVMAMLIIYIAGTFLFSIQKMPDYQIQE